MCQQPRRFGIKTDRGEGTQEEVVLGSPVLSYTSTRACRTCSGLLMRSVITDSSMSWEIMKAKITGRCEAGAATGMTLYTIFNACSMSLVLHASGQRNACLRPSTLIVLFLLLIWARHPAAIAGKSVIRESLKRAEFANLGTKPGIA